MRVEFFSNPRTKCNTVAHADFLEQQVRAIRLANSNVLARWVMQ